MRGARGRRGRLLSGWGVTMSNEMIVKSKYVKCNHSDERMPLRANKWASCKTCDNPDDLANMIIKYRPLRDTIISPIECPRCGRKYRLK